MFSEIESICMERNNDNTATSSCPNDHAVIVLFEELDDDHDGLTVNAVDPAVITSTGTMTFRNLHVHLISLCVYFMVKATRVDPTIPRTRKLPLLCKSCHLYHSTASRTCSH